MHRRHTGGSLFLTGLLSLFCLLLPSAALADVTVEGCIEYGSTNRSLEPGFCRGTLTSCTQDSDCSGGNICSGERFSIHERELKEGNPVAHVRIELRRSITTLEAGSTTTDADGCFSIPGVSGTPDILRVKARNDYVRVKAYEIVPLFTDSSISVDFDISDVYDGSATVNVGTKLVDDTDPSHTFVADRIGGGEILPASRAFLVASMIYRAARQIEAVTGTSLGEVSVRLGYDGILGTGVPSTAWFDQTAIPDTIHLLAPDAAIADHEYGHYVSKQTGGFGLIPSYLLQGGHSLCIDMNNRFGLTDECWPFFEGLASWYGAADSYGYSSPNDVTFFGPPTQDLDGDGTVFDEDAQLTLGDNWWVENNDYCTASERDTWTDPRQVESVVAQVLWDLIDEEVDSVNVYGVPFQEDAQVPIDDVMEVLMARIPSNTPCAFSNPYTHPVTLEQFCNEYLALHGSDNPYGVQPDLYIAYAYNNVADRCALDSDPPAAPAARSSTHPSGAWRNTSTVQLTIDDGADDLSGSYFYRYACAFDPALDLGDWDASTADLMSKAFENSVDVACVEGDSQYIVVGTRDVADHLGAQAVYGPVRIDLTPPFVNSSSLGTMGGPLVIGTFAHVTWDTGDALSGVDHVEVHYTGPTLGSGVASQTSPAAVGALDFYLDPDLFVPATGGTFDLVVYDVAGNQQSVSLGSVDIVSPFSAPHDLGFDLVDGRIVSGDLDGDGIDDLVVAGTSAGVTKLQTIGIGSTSVGQTLTPGPIGGDLFLADVDLDGDLDLIAGGDFGAGPEIRKYTNDGTGTLTDTGTVVYHVPPVPLPAFDGMVLRVVDLYNDGHPTLVYGGNRGAAVAQPELLAFDFVTHSLSPVPGTRFVGGDFEVGDIDGDLDLDFVTLTKDASGVGTLTTYEAVQDENGLTTWTTSGDLDTGLVEGDLDLGNLDHDGDLDLFAMFRKSTGGTVTDEAHILRWWGFGFAYELMPAAAISEGDGHIVEIYNDGLSDVLAMGRRLLMPPRGWYVSQSDLGVGSSGLPVPPRDVPLYATDTAWGDFDGDHDLDFCITGTSAGGSAWTGWYENLMESYGHANSRPAPPGSLTSEYDTARGGYVFRLRPPAVSADETARKAFRYEIRVGSSPGSQDVVSWAHPAYGSLQVAGDTFGDHIERFVEMPLGVYQWSARTVDGGWRRSMPAPEQTTASTATPCDVIPGDCDGDGTPDACETDTDGDSIPDDCDPDADNDGVPNAMDTAPTDVTICQDIDLDGCDDCSGGVDGFGPLSDARPEADGPDVDGDIICDAGDPCPFDNPDDTDGDGVCDSEDACPAGDDSVDSDGDGVADACDPCPLDAPDDTDGDTVCDHVDICPGFDDRLDTDADGQPDGCDPCPLDRLDDRDGDGICDSADRCPTSPDTLDADGDGVPDACDPCPTDSPDDSDGDGVCDAVDICPGLSDLEDTDGDGSAGPILLPEPLLALDAITFGWGSLADSVQKATGEYTNASDLADLSAGVVSTESGGTFSALGTPAVGTGRWYLVKVDCPTATWSTLHPSEADGRDTALP